MFVGSWHFENLGTMSWGFVRWFKESLCPVQPDLLLKLQVKLFQVWPRSVAESLTGSRRMKMVHALSCAFMCFHVLCFVIWRLRETGGMKEWFDQDLESSKQHQTHNLQFFGGIKMDHCPTVLRFYRVFFLDWKSSRSFHPWSPRMWGWQMSPASFWKTFWLARPKASWRRVAPVSGSKPVVQMEKRRKKVKASWNQVEKLWKEKVTWNGGLADFQTFWKLLEVLVPNILRSLRSPCRTCSWTSPWTLWA